MGRLDDCALVYIRTVTKLILIKRGSTSNMLEHKRFHDRPPNRIDRVLQMPTPTVRRLLQQLLGK
jgi:hypothetical protein